MTTRGYHFLTASKKYFRVKSLSGAIAILYTFFDFQLKFPTYCEVQLQPVDQDTPLDHSASALGQGTCTSSDSVLRAVMSKMKRTGRNISSNVATQWRFFSNQLLKRSVCCDAKTLFCSNLSRRAVPRSNLVELSKFWHRLLTSR
ncbi:uncharacterized protein PHALS_00385 [Plasmopara halstedii]|uniref:Uncharacterized protein n=1 Tax=Plasmopara halstedii TaxID=4781 RepID=A0A0P1A7S4_PLAHL|nr:uncharacterized protein PHALS_00385 [Plasmopara halstedii]CEG36065.1 hypothetical protein PHALS_00385 [Plasmopara halstedii]|eukprot:XP_024572434.1 hypothetical protein PHALS_00385 [Plasmopara halstedii]